ncbi:universal stress protein [Streptomyces sp. NBC_01235]|uniref:universal stress protein n=1 Tax=Streptomyces sp. NBC_01235 TaxID=2903788 RepID=UPI002E14BA00|nr:universal stress protein [Streptomyces sp. NBC_01235]
MAIPLVVGIDGSEASLEAVDWAADEAARHGVPLLLLHATDGDREPSDVIGAASERARQRAPTVRLSSEALHEDAASALVESGRNAFALVLGSRGLGDLAEMLLGAVSLAVAARADCPVVVVRGAAEHRDGRFGNIVVGVEEGEGSGTALQFALREAHVRSCRLTAVHAWNPSSRVLTPRPAPSWYALEAHRRPPSQVLDDALRGLAERYRDARVSPRVIEGPARRALLDAASAADLLVVGARGRQGHPGLQLGLINHALLHHAPCPVAVVPQT